MKQYNDQIWLKRVEDRYYMTYDKSMTRVPTYVAETIMGKDRITYIIGPYVFFNNFEETADGKYLIKMLPHWFNRKPVVDLKIRNIMDYAGYWVRINNETLKLMQEWRNGQAGEGYMGTHLQSNAETDALQ